MASAIPARHSILMPTEPLRAHNAIVDAPVDLDTEQHPEPLDPYNPLLLASNIIRHLNHAFPGTGITDKGIQCIRGAFDSVLALLLYEAFVAKVGFMRGIGVVPGRRTTLTANDITKTVCGHIWQAGML